MNKKIDLLKKEQRNLLSKRREILNKFPKNISNLVIKKSLYLTRNIILNKFFLPNNLTFPKSRVILENYFN